ncbi:MAG: 4Fe-4S binding protein [Bacilli bacterium]|nr:4Fe-4S binding protein [Bacilli bacterium]
MKLISLEKDPNIQIDNKLYTFIDPDFIYIPINNQQILVEQNAFVYKGQKVLKNSSLLSSISGKAYGLQKCLVDHHQEKCIVIENDFREKVKNGSKMRKNITIGVILESLEAHNSHLLPLFKNLVTCENIVVRCFDDEPYVMNDIMALKENIDAILECMDALSLLYKSKKVTLVVKNTESEIIEECLNVIGTYPNINLSIITAEYLLGRKEYLLPKLNLEPSKTLYLTVMEIIELIKIVKYNKKESTKYITLSGDAIKLGKVIKVKKYTKLQDIIKKYVQFITKDYMIIINNLLWSHPVNEELIITDKISSIHFMKRQVFQEEKCTLCGLCEKICPVGVDPVECLRRKKKNQKCISCGLCSYICPSYINLSTYVSGEEK